MQRFYLPFKQLNLHHRHEEWVTLSSLDAWLEPKMKGTKLDALARSCQYLLHDDRNDPNLLATDDQGILSVPESTDESGPSQCTKKIIIYQMYPSLTHITQNVSFA